MKFSVFYKSAENPIGIRQSAGDIASSTVDELGRLKKELATLLTQKKEPDNKEIQDIKRRIARLERFDKVKESATGDDAVAIEKILKGKTSENYLSSDLLSLKKRGIDITGLVLVARDRIEWEVSSTSLKEKELYTVNFGKNTHLNAQIGAWDILPPDITEITINGKVGKRKESPRPGYYDSITGKYLPIFDGDTIEIVSRWKISDKDQELARKASEERWAHMRASDMLDYNDKAPLTDLEEDKSLFSEVARVAKERGVKKLESLYAGGEKAKFAVNSFMSLGWTKEQSIGIVANLIGESNLSHTVDTGDGGRAYGIAQWHPDRQRNFAKVFWKSIQWSTLEEQLSFVDWELRNTERNAWEMLKNSSSIASATEVITHYYERPFDKHGDTKKRQQIASQIEAKITA